MWFNMWMHQYQHGSAWAVNCFSVWLGLNTRIWPAKRHLPTPPEGWLSQPMTVGATGMPLRVNCAAAAYSRLGVNLGLLHPANADSYPISCHCKA